MSSGKNHFFHTLFSLLFFCDFFLGEKKIKEKRKEKEKEIKEVECENDSNCEGCG